MSNDFFVWLDYELDRQFHVCADRHNGDMRRVVAAHPFPLRLTRRVALVDDKSHRVSRLHCL